MISEKELEEIVQFDKDNFNGMPTDVAMLAKEIRLLRKIAEAAKEYKEAVDVYGKASDEISYLLGETLKAVEGTSDV